MCQTVKPGITQPSIILYINKNVSGQMISLWRLHRGLPRESAQVEELCAIKKDPTMSLPIAVSAPLEPNYQEMPDACHSRPVNKL